MLASTSPNVLSARAITSESEGSESRGRGKSAYFLEAEKDCLFRSSPDSLSINAPAILVMLFARNYHLSPRNVKLGCRGSLSPIL